MEYMSYLSKSVDKAYEQREQLIIIGLTGRTGSGCSTVSSILQKEKIDELDLRHPKSFDYKDIEERKYSIIHNYLVNGKRWTPFSVIECSSVILSFVFEKGFGALIKYLNEIQKVDKNKSFIISDFRNLEASLKGMDYIFGNIQKYPLYDIYSWINDEEKVTKYYEFYTRTMMDYKERFKSLLLKYSCHEVEKSKWREEKKSQAHLYTYLLQKFGNNIRSSGDPFRSEFLEENYFDFPIRIDNIIQIIHKYNNIKKNKKTRICIDAIRSPFEALYFRDKYKAFYLLSINTDDQSRKKRLDYLNQEELNNLDQIEYPQKVNNAQEVFYHQNIQNCLEIADIHIYNPNIEDNKYYFLTSQLIKYITLMIHPGLITPTHIERCMQLAYNAKFNSGCLSRQVGAVVTSDDYSVKSVGWNDVPEGQVSCNLRDIHGFCKNKDSETYSGYEITDKSFYNVLELLNNKVKPDTLSGRTFPYCFKDIYNGMHNDKNQVYTRALHAEENAFLQITKYGGQGVKGGYLFTTASPCELCAKKAYQLGINKIFYIDPYPGISQKHILDFGEKDNPEMCLFYGAIGNAYISLYAPRIQYKDELELVTGINSKVEAKKAGIQLDSIVSPNEIKNKKVIVTLVFESRETIYCDREAEFIVECETLKQINRKLLWTGSSYDGSSLLKSNGNYKLRDLQSKNSPYNYVLEFGEEKKKGDVVSYKIRSNVKDQEHIMYPYLAHIVNQRVDYLEIKILTKPNIIKNVKKIVYADTKMEVKFSEIPNIEFEKEDEFESYKFSIEDPNLFYSYCLEWEFEN